jgi:maltose phosphorylase
MKSSFPFDPWKITENVFDPDRHEFSESIMSLGNGHMGMRGNFCEDYNGPSLQGTYIAGIYYPDKTRVGWWKNGYPEYFAKVLNACFFMGISLEINGTTVDLNQVKIKNYSRILDMYRGTLTREVTVTLDDKDTKISSSRFFSMDEPEIACLKYEVTPVGHTATIKLSSMMNGDVRNSDANYDEIFWDTLSSGEKDGIFSIIQETRKTKFSVAYSMTNQVTLSCTGDEIKSRTTIEKEICKEIFALNVSAGCTLSLEKIVAVCSSRDYSTENLLGISREIIMKTRGNGYSGLLKKHCTAWKKLWSQMDIIISEDPAAQQGIRFNLFHLKQTYTGNDPLLNIGPKGFTGEKYGGSTYWDTEAFCLPFFLGTSPKYVGENLLKYRYLHLDKAKENAEKLGLKGALYPMVTMNGEECHNEWEITFEEIHRNTAITYAIYNYSRYHNDYSYLYHYGIDVLVETSRFWASRCQYHREKEVYMILGVTGPNEYENNVNNNWYTNRMAAWSLKYTTDTLDALNRTDPEMYEEHCIRLNIGISEITGWVNIYKHMYYPTLYYRDLFSQNDGFCDKEISPVSALSPEDRPLNQNWSWDRILRSCYIKQADLLQGMYQLYEHYDLKTIREHFNYYEPLTVHESSLSASVHGVLASNLKYSGKAYDFFMQTARLDLDNYNKDTEDGLHITSMSGSWLVLVHGFAGMKIINNTLHFSPDIPKKWNMYSFNLMFRNRLLNICVKHDRITFDLTEGEALNIEVYKKQYVVTPYEELPVYKIFEN